MGIIDFKSLKARTGGVKVTVDEVIKRGFFAIHAVEQRTWQGEVYLVFFNDKDEYMGSFTVILDFFARIIDEHGLAAVNESLKKEPMYIKIRRETSAKNNRIYSDFDILEKQQVLQV